MKNAFQELNKAFESRIRLGIMSALMVNDFVDFNTLKELLELTDGNLASHLRALEQLAYVRVEKSFLGRKPNTRYAVTPEGRVAFELHIVALEKIIKSM
jgi:DNA-binding HxlR family transcriptional regulator